MYNEISPEPGNHVKDGVELIRTAYRLSHAVSRYNRSVGTSGRLATYEVYTQPEEAEPPINAPRTAEPGEFYTRLSYPDHHAFDEIRDIEADLIYSEYVQTKLATQETHKIDPSSS